MEPDKAWYCIQSLQKSLQRKQPRKSGPSIYEIQSLKNFSPMLCRLCSLDGSQKAIYVDSSTTVPQAINTFCQRINLPFSHWKWYCINLLRPETEELGMFKGIPFLIKSLTCKLCRIVNCYYWINW